MRERHIPDAAVTPDDAGRSAYALRPATPDDAEFLYRVYASTRDEELGRVSWSPEQRALFLRMQFDAQSRHYHAHFPAASFAVVEVGFARAGRFTVDRTPAAIRIIDIALLPEFRRRGIGERLLRDVCAEADAAKAVVILYVEVHNAARRLYERLGFRVHDDPAADAVYVRMERRQGVMPV